METQKPRANESQKHPRLWSKYSRRDPIIGDYRVTFEDNYYGVTDYLGDEPQTPEDYADMGPFMTGNCANCNDPLTYLKSVLIHEPTRRIKCRTHTGRRVTRSGSFQEGSQGYWTATHEPMSWEDYKSTYGNYDNYQAVIVTVERYGLGVCGHNDCRDHVGWVEDDGAIGTVLYTPREGWVDIGVGEETVDGIPEHVRVDFLPAGIVDAEPDDARRNGVDDGATGIDDKRYWILDSHEYTISLDGATAEYAGLVDERAGGIVAYGPWDNLVTLAKELNGPTATGITEKWLESLKDGEG